MLIAVAIDEEMASFFCPSFEVPAPPVELPGRFFSGEDKVGSSIRYDGKKRKYAYTQNVEHLIVALSPSFQRMQI